jgi:asparagine synthase (glutamine-hydrolysing)
MSSIFGQLNFNKQLIVEENLTLAENELNHWQADDKRTWISNNVGLGHLMLYNTPESLTEKQPLHKSYSRLTITADARIDNRDDLFLKLDIAPVKTKVIGDGELILLAYEKYGEKCVKHIIGDFAFAIWDENEQKLFCARDHLGVKPFFYIKNSGFFAFATEKKGILVLPGVDKTINKQFFYNSLIRPHEQAFDTTLYQHINRLAPAHTLTVNAANGTIKLTHYWTLDADTEIRFARRDDYYEGLLEQFEQAVKCRTRSHFGVGTQLSGGMDSSAITGVAARLMRGEGRELYTLSNTLPDDVTDTEITKLDERRFIDEVNNFNNIKKPLHITANVFENYLAGIDFSLLVNDGIERWDPTWLIPLKKTAMRHNIRTLLSGFPGDELITYRGKFYFLDYLDQGNYLKYFTAKKKHPGFSKLQPIMPFSLQHAVHKFKTRLNINNNDVKSVIKMFNIPQHYLQHRNDCIWSDPNFQDQFKSYRHFQKYRLLKPHAMHRMESETRYGLYFKTEPRFPMADIRLTQYYLSMPNEIKYEGTLARTAFRKAMKNDLPQMILERDSKYGSIVPFFALVPPEPELLTNLLEKLPANTSVNKGEIIKRINLNTELGEAIREEPRKVRIMSKLPDARILRWLEKNPDVII